MPYSFTKIEKDKSMTIGFVFLFLIGFYFIVALGLYFVSKMYFYYEFVNRTYSNSFDGLLHLSLKEIGCTLCVAFAVGLIHWMFSVAGSVTRILNLLRARPINSGDQYHSVFGNILEELSVATGGEKFEGVVVPSLALNAFAVADFEGRQVIGVTEGLLNRLNRAQLETVVAHESGHILHGDCLETTVTTSLFELYGDLLKTSNSLMESDGRGRSRAVFFFVLVSVFLSITLFISKLFKMFISREREFRADATAVRLTRDPLSLAEALFQISSRWRGYSIHGDGLEAIFTVNPRFQELDEEEGMWSELFSTHPPVRKRLDILLGMAHADMNYLNNKFAVQEKNKTAAPEYAPLPNTEIKPGLPTYYLHTQGAWRGPLSVNELINGGMAGYDDWVSRAGTTRICRLFEDPDLKNYYAIKTEASSALKCPRCQINLSEDHYKGAPILRCPQCHGVFLNEGDVEKILIREDYYFSAEIRRAALDILNLQEKAQIRSIDLKTANLFMCPKCKDLRMLKNFYTLVYPVEIDRCNHCQSVWFDKHELEILQYMVEHRRPKK